MAKLGSPPAASVLRQLDPPWVNLRAGEDKLARIYHASGPHRVAWNQFRTWGPARNARFDHHQPGARGILYCARQGMTCLAEVFQGTRVVNRTDDDPYLCVFACTRDLKLLDLTGEFATRMGASLAIHSGSRNRARQWVRVLHDVFDHDGLLYLSSMHPGAAAIALNERAVDALPAAPLANRPLGDPVLTDVIDALTLRLGYLKQ